MQSYSKIRLIMALYALPLASREHPNIERRRQFKVLVALETIILQ